MGASNISIVQNVLLLLVFTSGAWSFKLCLKETDSLAVCEADLNSNFAQPDPLMLRPGVTYNDVEDYEEAFVLPDATDGILRLAMGDRVRLVCPGSTLTLTGKTEDVAVCQGNNQFQIGSNSAVAISKLSCKSSPTNTAIIKDVCGPDGIGVELGFKIDTMYPLIYTCFNNKTKQTYWSKERVTAELKGYETGEASPSFKEDDFYPGLAVDNLYDYNNQVTAFTKILGSSALANKYLKDQNYYYLARGHFAPRADFVFGAHTRATFHFINVNPQWQIFNGGVWNNLEMAVRDFAIRTSTDFIAYTGPYDILKYPDTKNVLQPLYLANPGTAQQTLEVPKFYWKILLNPATNKGVAFVGINDPHVPLPYPADYVICPDVLSKISWLKIKNSTWLYACEVDSFLEVSDKFPKVQVTGLLDS